jgi:hypothetical protein
MNEFIKRSKQNDKKFIRSEQLLGNRADLNIFTWEISRSIQEEQPQSCKQCCGTETGTPAFFLCVTRTGMHCGSGTGYRPGSNIK